MLLCKLQICCLIIVLYIAYIYHKECKRTKRKHKIVIFDGLLILSLINIVFDTVCTYTVNHIGEVAEWVNPLLHLGFLISIDGLIFLMFLYMVVITEAFPKKTKKQILLFLPFIANVGVVVYHLDSLEYAVGTVTNYAKGTSANTCFIMAGIYTLLTILLIFKRWQYIERHKRASILVYILVVSGAAVYQTLIPEALITSFAVTMVIVGVYMNQENPALSELEHYHDEMVMGFATLVENRDDSTGGHIKRTSMYAELLAKELRARGYYTDILTKDYIKNLLMAAPMHDIGKIAVPDAILQKPGRLTDEEFNVMKRHSLDGGQIIKETFGNIENPQYKEMAYEVAIYHHEKWNGKGYPRGLKEQEIPLCARIMAVADVFDAISENRCYRKAMPMDQCFAIIAEGSGSDFDPLLADIFLDIRYKVEKIHDTMNAQA